jgi:hypothetical protein
MANLPLGTIVACEDGAPALVWEHAHGLMLGLPIRHLRRPRTRSDVVLTSPDARRLGIPTTTTMVIETHHRVLIDPDTCKVIRDPDAPLQAAIRQTMERARRAAAFEQAF